VFRFKLQPVLEMRRREERAEQVAVAALERERAELESAIRAGDEAARRENAHLVAMLHAGGSGSGGSVDIRGARLQAGAALHAGLSTRDAAARLEGVITRLGSARQRLAQAAARRRGVEALRDRQRERYEQDLRRREQALLDDLSSTRTARTRTDDEDTDTETTR